MENNRLGKGRQLGFDPVVSVRLPLDLEGRLTALAERTRRSRSVYVREALERMLPLFETAYWDECIREGSLEFDRRFVEIVRDLSGDEGFGEPESTETDQQG